MTEFPKGGLEFGVWILDIAWDLLLGIWDFFQLLRISVPLVIKRVGE
jgi:hypothetical protein